MVLAAPAQIVVIHGRQIVMDQTERVDHFHGCSRGFCILKFSTTALVGEPDEGWAQPLARCQHRVLDGCGQFWLTPAFSQCPRQEGIACVTMCLEYGRHTAIVGCNRD